MFSNRSEKLKEIALRAWGGEGSAISNLLEIIRALQAAAGNALSRGHIFDQTNPIARQIVEHPMHPRAGRRVRIVADERKRFYSLWRAAPLQRRRDIDSVARVLARNRLAFRKRRTRQLEFHFALFRFIGSGFQGGRCWLVGATEQQQRHY